jgi:hypothetical protein
MNAAAGPSRHGTRRRVAAIALMALFAAAAVHAARLGIADAYELTARLEMQRWENRPADGQSLARATGWVTQSLRYAPHHPAALEDLGGLQLRQMHAATDPQLAVDLARGAYQDFRLALVERPTAALNWARVALTKLYLAEQDEELLSALRQSVALGPRSPGVPEIVLRLGLALWPRIDPALRREVVAALEFIASRDAAAALAIGQSYGRYDLICDITALRTLAGNACGQPGDGQGNRGGTP